MAPFKVKVTYCHPHTPGMPLLTPCCCWLHGQLSPSRSSCQWSLKLLIDHICPRHPSSHRSQSKRRSVRCGKLCPRLPCFVVKQQWSHVHRVLPSPCQSLLKRGSVRTGPSGGQEEPDSCRLEPPLCLSLASELNP